MSYFIFFFTTLLLIAIDLFGSYYFGKLLSDGSVISLIANVINLRYVENTGAAFGIFSSKPLLITIINITALCGLIIYALVKMKELSKDGYLIPLSMVIAGGLGNIIDRIINGFVTDYFEFAFFDFPVFNFADIFITLGAVAIIFLLIFELIKDHKKDETK
ncbi:MAG: signal peptidase II [Clostridia bacterium]|nr:signal peptidase II [Clostridia bacterium]